MCSTRTRESDDEAFVQLVTAEQPRLYGFILSLLSDVEQAKDVLQETNLVLWRKMDSYQKETNFGAWARKIAHYQVLAHCRDHKRDCHIFDSDLIGKLADVAERRMTKVDERTIALHTCLKKLTDQQRELLRDRYSYCEKVADIARRLGRSASRVSNLLFEIRRQLFECIERTVGMERQP